MAATVLGDQIEARVEAIRDKVVEAVREAILQNEPERLADVAARAARRVRHRLADAADLRDEAIYRIKRQPVRAIALAFGAGTVLGVLLGRLAGPCQAPGGEAKLPGD
ncbi:MAG TPA: hypothetical protein VD833_04590 [Vicinamibacterales bacterium]|nr:hypothetical protein [Vicinamibacterales bacterium]